MTDHASRRTTMVDTQVRPAEVTKYPILEAMLNVPREAFVPPGREEVAYLGENLWLAPGRVILEPRSFGKMLEALDLLPGERVLHVGAGLGYGAAVMARMGAHVVAIEEDAGLAAEAEATLAREGAQAFRDDQVNRAGAAAAIAREGAEVVVRHGPLAAGAPDLGPFDAIVIEGAVEEVPPALLAQLAPAGRIAAIYADGQLGTARLGREAAGQVNWRYLFNAGAPVLPGFKRAPAFVF